jgi:hypothetical protein
MKSIENSSRTSEDESSDQKRLRLPVMCPALHPSGVWTPKRYTKKLIAKAIKMLEKGPSDNSDDDDL